MGCGELGFGMWRAEIPGCEHIQDPRLRADPIPISFWKLRARLMNLQTLGNGFRHNNLRHRGAEVPRGVTGRFFLQGEYSGFVYSYAVEEPLAVVHKVAGYLPSLFWGFITLGRLISIPVSYRMKPATMVFINVVRMGLIALINRFLWVGLELQLLSRLVGTGRADKVPCR